MASFETHRISPRTVIGLVTAIAATDVVVNVFAPEDAKVSLKLAIAIGFVAWARLSARLSWDELGLGRRHVRDGFRIGALALLAIGVVILVLVVVPGSRSYFDDSSVAADSTAQRVLQPLLFIPLGTVLFEELLFRGVLLAALQRVWSRPASLIVSSVCFGLWHLPPALRDASDNGAAAAVGVVVGTIAVTTVAGAGFAWLRLRSGSLIAPMMAHLATNSLAYAAAVAVV
jgi:membrane protease YdiL (CAAX protease family)